MQIRVQCPACSASFEVPAQLVGRDGECSQCQKVFKLVSLSDEVDPAALAGADSGATMAMPVYDGGESSSDTDEFDIPPQSVSESDVPELNISDVPELDIPSATAGGQQKSSAEQSKSDLATEASADETALPLIEDDGSLFGDELPELEDVPEPVSRYASEDEVDPDAGGAYSLSGSTPSSDKSRAKKPRRKKSRPKRKPAASSSDEGYSDSSADDVQLFDDVLHDEDDDDTDSSSSQVMLKRSGTFSSSGGSQSASDAPASHQSKKRSKKRSKAGSSDQTDLPVLKRLTGGTRSSADDSESSSSSQKSPSKKPRRTSQGSPRQLMMIVGGGIVLLLLAQAYSWLTSGPAVVSPTFQGGANGAVPSGPTGPAPIPNQGGESIQTGRTNSSAVRANRIRSTPGAPRRVDSPDSGTDNVAQSDAAGSSAEPASSDSDLDTQPKVAPTKADEPEQENDPLKTATLASLRPNDTSGKTASLQANRKSADEKSDSPEEKVDQLFPVESVPIPEFPELGVPRPSTVAGVVYHEIVMGQNDRDRSPDSKPLPGSQMDMILYLPSGTHEPASLPCVMIAAAGTTLLEGNGCFDESYQSETIPYVQQGFAVLGYSLDGPVSSDQPSNRESAEAYQQFRAAHAGLVNARNALEFLLQQASVINPEMIFTAGHSSAGTLSLLFAEHESRLAGCIAYAPCVDIEKRLLAYTSNPLVKELLPGVDDFVRQQSPARHIESLRCPVFIFHAENDSNAPVGESQQFAASLDKQGASCRLETIPEGDHYSSMLEEGIPRGLAWLKEQQALVSQ